MDGPGKDILDGPQFGQFSSIKHCDSIADFRNDAQVVSDKHQ